MPTKKKRVNLSIPEDVYEKLQEYKAEFSLDNDATACLQLVRQQLKAHDEQKIYRQLFRTLTPEQLQQLSSLGVSQIKAAADRKTE